MSDGVAAQLRFIIEKKTLAKLHLPPTYKTIRTYIFWPYFFYLSLIVIIQTTLPPGIWAKLSGCKPINRKWSQCDIFKNIEIISDWLTSWVRSLISWQTGSGHWVGVVSNMKRISLLRKVKDRSKFMIWATWWSHFKVKDALSLLCESIRSWLCSRV